jgi:hypothetical protein
VFDYERVEKKWDLLLEPRSKRRYFKIMNSSTRRRGKAEGTKVSRGGRDEVEEKPSKVKSAASRFIICFHIIGFTVSLHINPHKNRIVILIIFAALMKLVLFPYLYGGEGSVGASLEVCEFQFLLIDIIIFIYLFARF